jgi:hypothetical protein
MFEAGDPDLPLGDIETQDEDLPESDNCGVSLGGKRQFPKRAIAGKEGTPRRICEENGTSVVASVLRKKIAIRLDEECLDISPEFCGVLIENLAIFGDEISRFAFSPRRLRELFRCCVLLSVLEFYDYEYSREVSEVTTFMQSLIQKSEN